MKAPCRLLEDPEQPVVLREDLQRVAASPDRYDTARGLALLQTTLGNPDGFGDALARSADTAGASLGAGTTSAMPVALKWLLVAAISGGSIGTFTWLSAPSEPAAPAPTAAPATAAPAAPAAPAATIAPTAPAAHSGGQPVPSPAPVAPHRHDAPATEPSSPALSSPQAATGMPTSTASRREIAQLVRIRALLERDPAAAHRAIAAAQREFPSGVLREEREGLDAIALFRSGRERRARTSAERFIARYPDSPLRPRLERLLAGEDP